MSNVCKSISPFLHLLPVQSEESLAAFQNRLVLSLTDNNPSQLSIPISSPSLPVLSPTPISTSDDSSDRNTVSASELQQCLISPNCIAILTKQGRVGRIKLEVTNDLPPPDVKSQQEETASAFGLSQNTFSLQQGIQNPVSLSALQDPNRSMPVETSDTRDIHGLRIKDVLKLSKVEWTPIDQVFTCIAVVTSEIILVSRGQLYSWALEETEVSPHPKSADLQLAREEIISLSAARLRVSLATLSGKVATFYDASITRHTDISGSNLIATLSHPLLSVGLPSGDTITSLSVSETASYLLSKSGRVLWWGLLPTDKKRKSSSRSHSSEPISVDSFVCLRDSFPYTPGCLLLNLSTPYHPILATMISSDTDSDSIQVKPLGAEGEEARWKLSETLSLEDHVGILGRVIAVDKDVAVINTSQKTDSNEQTPGCIKVYSLDKVQVATRSEVRVDISSEDRESVNTAQGLVQLQPTCLLDPGERPVRSGVITGFRCISLTSHLNGPFLLLERLCDNKIFLLNSALSLDKPSTPTVYSGSVKNILTGNNATCNEESIPATTSGLLATDLPSAKFVASSCSNTQIMLDSHGYIRPIQSFYRLRPPFCHIPVAFESISMSRLLIKKQEYIVLLCVGKEKKLIRAIEEFDLDLVKELTEKNIHVSALHSTSEEYSRIKRPKITPEISETQSERSRLNLEESSFFLEKSCGNRNILHTCIQSIKYSNQSRMFFGLQKDTPNCIKFNTQQTESDIQSSSISILSYFFSLPALTDVIHHLLCQREVSGYTPFMLALKNQDLPAATLLLDYVENMPNSAASLRQQSHLYEDAIAQPGYDELLPIQVLLFNSALPYCEFGLKTILIQSSTSFRDSRITPRSLLSYIQNRYPSAYRCEAYVPGKNPILGETILSQPSLRNSISQFRSLCEVDKYPSLGPLSNSLEFLVAFSDVREMRDAICVLHSNKITSLSHDYDCTLHAQQYYGQELFVDSWNVEMQQSYATRPDDMIKDELSRVSLVKRLIEVISPQQQSGQENVLSSIIRDHMLVAYLEDMHNISDTAYQFTFGKTSVAEPTIQHGIDLSMHNTALLMPEQPTNLNHQTVHATTDIDISDVDTEHDEILSMEIESTLYILANSWPIISSALLHSRAPEESSFSQRDSFILSLILNSTGSVLNTVLRVIMSKIEQIEPDLFIQSFTNSKIGLTLEEEDAYVITVVKKFIQSLVRLYTKSIGSDSMLETATDSSTSNTQLNLRKIRDRIDSVLRAFDSLSVQELFIAAQGLCGPIMTGNLKHYQYINRTQLFNVESQPATVRQVLHHQHVPVIAHTSLELPTLPKNGLKLPFSEPAVKQLEIRSKEKRERSDYWGRQDVIASSDSDSNDENEEIANQPVVPAEDDEQVPHYHYDEDEEYPFYGNGDVQQRTSQTYRSRISWLVDALEDTVPGHQQKTYNSMAPVPQLPFRLNTLNGGVILARTFSRLLKAALKLFLPLPDDSDTDNLFTDLPHVSFPATTRSRMLCNLPELVEPVFQWAARLLDLAENQIELGKKFKLDSRYTHTLPRGDLTDSRSVNSFVPLTQFGDYTNYLLCLNAGETSNLLPVIDIGSYEHVAFILDAHIYFATNWEKCTHVTLQTLTATPVSNAPETGSNFFLRQSSLIVSKHKQQQQLTEPNFIIPLKMDIPLAEKPHLLKPDISNTTLFSVPTPTPSMTSPYKLSNKPNVLSYTHLEANPTFSISQLTTQELMNRWKNVIQAFVDVFIASGPSNELDNFLITRAGFAGKKARFYAILNTLNARQSTIGRRSMHLGIKRSELLKDSLSKIYSLTFNPKGSFDVSFEGEKADDVNPTGSLDASSEGENADTGSLDASSEGEQADGVNPMGSLDASSEGEKANGVNPTGSLDASSEGKQSDGAVVIVGFYTVLANALKSAEKLPLNTKSLFHEPGKIPEQAAFYAPTPTLLPPVDILQMERLTYYRAIGKFFGMSLYFKQTIPLLLSRHVLKYLLDRQISWHDVGFFNADLYEGLRRMIVHCQEEEMTHEMFQSIYMLNFDATVNGKICEIKPGGKSIPVTPDNVLEYVRLYSMYLMIGSVKQELEEMKTGFRMILPADFTQGLTAEDLQLLLSGGNTIVSYTRLKEQTIFIFSIHPTETDKLCFMKNFFKLIRRMTNSQRQQLLYFCTGSAILAADRTLNFTVGHVGGMEAAIPLAPTCSRYFIRIPCYKDYATLKCKIMAAIACDSY